MGKPSRTLLFAAARTGNWHIVATPLADAPARR
ncbi:hypothetical protein BLA9940_03194 [Burkholderia aenigmatica]|uniref:Uncharacterized protein n=1 Tax=Burkholderia aenigmatica TaxID=2015348 RepID=A0A6J5ISR5_9BURK|nr:hypothetical protein BLA3211_00812 [Burkholderia aenigmatica]VWC53065.1 hypothetical protein BLA17378_01113 [Burkholderia aenigmatica]VWC61512.1 hypothetical protein BLA9940_03194 [Burkholderia aenigmatica]VWC72018.1 hypothetical protein BLA18628_00596 [Burkholderia aenigmatica]